MVYKTWIILPVPANGKKSDSELTIKEVSSKLDISEPTIKKYLKDFDLPSLKGSWGKVCISHKTFQALTEIAKLRANGLSIQEIKELKSQEPSKNILDEMEETESTKKTETPAHVATLEQEPEQLKEEVERSEEKLEEKPEEKSDEEPEEGQRRRRGFNYRYIERQISNDSKRVSFLRQRLRNPNLSVQDRLFFEEALERRILFLNGWKHILRWVSK